MFTIYYKEMGRDGINRWRSIMDASDLMNERKNRKFCTFRYYLPQRS